MIIVSLILELIINKYINQNSLFIPLFLLISIIYINKNKYYLKIFIIGVIYDLFFTPFYILNGFIYLIIGFINKVLFHYFNNKFIDYIIITIIDIFIYQIILYLLLLISNHINYNINELFFIIKHFFIINIIYSIILFLIKRKKLQS